MATYIKGADTYLPDIKPFTPDYKFLSAVLETRKDKYDSNFKATNDIYNKVVYSDLSRVDTREKRDQFAENLGPSIEKISGMDLSLQQNADAAQNVFAPFYEDDLIVRDIVQTAQYRKESSYANRLLESGTEEGADRYSANGVKSLQYKMDDFINATPEKALGMAAPNYVDGVNLFNLSQEILGSMDPPLSMEMDMGTTADGKFLIRQKNGALITGAALNVLEQTLLKDPRVIAAYHDDAFVSGRNFAAQGIQNGRYSNVEQGQEAWANETINRINTLNAEAIGKNVIEASKAEAANVTWENYKAKNGIIPGSDLDIAMQEQMSAAEATKAALDAKMEVKRVGEIPTKTLPGTLNKAYNMILSYNLGSDMHKAATAFASQDQSYLLRDNNYELLNQKFLYNMAEIKAKADNAVNLAKLKGEIVMPNQDDLANKLTKPVITFNAATGFDYEVDPETLEPDENADLIIKLDEDIVTEGNKLMNNQLGDLLNMMQILNPLGDNVEENQTYGIKLSNGEDYRGTIAEIRKVLSQTEEGETEELMIYPNKNTIQELFSSTSEIFKDTRELTLQNPEMTIGTDRRNQYDALYKKIFGLGGTQIQEAGFNQAIETSKQNQLEAYKLVEAQLTRPGDDLENTNVRDLVASGFPSILDNLGNVIPKDKYLEKVTDLIRKGEITNPDLKGWDSGSDSKNYMIPAYNEVKGYDPTYKRVVTRQEPKYNTDGSRAMMIDMSAVKNDAEEMHNTLYAGLNTMLLSGEVSTGNLYATLGGNSEGAADYSANPSISYTINPLVTNQGTLEGQKELSNFIDQINRFELDGVIYGIVQGDINNVDAESLMVKDPVAVKAWNLYKEDLATWYGNPKRSNSDAIAPIADLVYNSVYGKASDGEKTTAGYQIKFSPEWLASKQQGSNTKTSSEFGAFTKEEILKLSGESGNGEENGIKGSPGISFIFDQRYDNNVKSKNNTYYSQVETAILSGSNSNYADFTVPDGINSTAEYRVIKNGINDYWIHYDLKTYVPYDAKDKTGGTYSTEKVSHQLKPEVLRGNLKNLDEAVEGLQTYFEQHRQMNIDAEAKDRAINGQK
jgi:hypothetical protein